MVNYIKILELLNKSKWWLIVLLFLSFVISIFSNEIKRILDIKLFNEDVVINSLDKSYHLQNVHIQRNLKQQYDQLHLLV